MLGCGTPTFIFCNVFTASSGTDYYEPRCTDIDDMLYVVDTVKPISAELFSAV